jgi:exosortase E/protease (VPEID-CTERM system)
MPNDRIMPRLLALGLVGVGLLAEYLSLSLLFNFGPLRSFEPVRVLSSVVDTLAPIGILAAATLILMAVGSRRRLRWADVRAGLVLSRTRLSAHAASFGALFVSSYIWFPSAKASHVGAGAGAFWLLAALMTVVTGAGLVRVETNGAGIQNGFRRAAGLAFLIGLALYAGFAARLLWASLHDATLSVAIELASWRYEHLVVDYEHSVIGTPGFVVRVTHICSGFEGMGLMAVLLPAFILVNRERFIIPRAFLLVPIAIIGVWLLNCVRIVLLIILGTEVSPQLAIGAFHSKAGWFFFSLVAIAMAFWGIHSRLWSRSVETDGERAEVHNPSVPYLAPLLALIATGMVTGALAVDVDWFYGLRAVPAIAILWACRTAYRGMGDGFSWRAAGLAGLGSYAVWWALSEPQVLPSWFFVSGRESSATPDAAAAAGSAYVVWTVIRALVSSTVVPIVEELAFRGYLLRRFVHVEFETVAYSRATPLAIAGSSLLFGLFHDAWLAGSAAGLIFAWVQIRSGSIANAIVAHAIANVGVAIHVLALGGQW